LAPGLYWSLSVPRPSGLLAQALVLDLRSLALMRIALGAILIADLALRAPDLALFYSDGGAVPMEFLRQPHYAWGFSFHLLHGSTAVQAMLFVVTGLAAAALMVGWRTRLAAAASWLMLLSLQHRNAYLLHGGDMLLAAALFWGLFLPWGRRFSVDALRTGGAPASNGYFGVPGAAWIGQICILYAFSVLVKSGSQWREEGTAIAYVLQAGQWNTSLAHLALGAPPWLLKGLTFGVLGLEALCPLALLLPWRHGVLRTVILVLLCAMHAGIGTMLAIGLFPLISIATLLGLLPPGAWAFAGRLRPGRALGRAAGTVELWMRRRLAATARPLSQTAPPSRIARRTVAAVCATAFALVLACNIESVWAWRMPRLARAPMVLLRLNQYWNLFAPQAGQDTWWHVVRGQLEGGRKVDLFRGGEPLTYDEPDLPSRLYPNQRWVKFMDAMGSGHMEPCRQAWLDHLCREWNAHHGGADRLRSADILFLARPIRLDDVRQPPRIVVLGTRACLAASELPVAGRSP
jgi:Vitamin K-dependent gamma-carboxylase